MSETGASRELRSKNRRTTFGLVLVVAGMFGFGYALIPLYDVFCELTGLNGKGIQVQTATAPLDNTIDTNRLVTVEFTGAIMGGLPWDFQPSRSVKVHPGETVRIVYTATNLADNDVTGQAVPSVSPPKATRHFVKTECFCFSNQTLGPREVKEMPLIFRVDSDLPEQVKTITLSYAFYRAEAAKDSSS